MERNEKNEHLAEGGGDYAGPAQIIFGVHDAYDSAAPVARKLVAALRAGKLGKARRPGARRNW